MMVTLIVGVCILMQLVGLLIVMSYRIIRNQDSILRLLGSSVKEETSLRTGKDGGETGFFPPSYNQDEVMSDEEHAEYEWALENGHVKENI